MKKILFYCDTVFGVGGVQRVLAEVAKRLSEEYEVTILTTDDIRQTHRYGYDRSSVRFVSLTYAPVSIWRRLRQKCCSFVFKYLLPKNEWTCSMYARQSPRYSFRHLFSLPVLPDKAIRKSSVHT